MTKDATARRNQRHHMPHLQQELDTHHSNRSHYVNVCYDLAILSDFCKESHQMLLPNRNLWCSKKRKAAFTNHIYVSFPLQKVLSKREWKRTTRKNPKIQVLTHGFFGTILFKYVLLLCIQTISLFAMAIIIPLPFHNYCWNRFTV